MELVCDKWNNENIFDIYISLLYFAYRQWNFMLKFLFWSKKRKDLDI